MKQAGTGQGTKNGLFVSPWWEEKEAAREEMSGFATNCKLCQCHNGKKD